MMDFEIYCDESHPDVFWSRGPNKAKYCMIGSLWLPAESRTYLKTCLGQILNAHKFQGEIKWHKVHKLYESLYQALGNFYLDMNRKDILRFRCIAVDANQVDLVRFHESDAELGFYKFYYQMLVHWIYDFNRYRVFCDEKTNRVGDRLETLRKVLDRANITSDVVSAQALPSHEVVLIQLTDFLLGMASSRMNKQVIVGSTKDRIIHHFEQGLGWQLCPTPKGNTQFNIFKINLQGGW